MNALVSIITPLYNSEAYISETINSVLSQTYTNWELILIDDYSSDNTLGIVKSYTDKYNNIKLLRNENNSGAAISRNKGITEASGKFIAFLDADDLWKPNKLEVQVAILNKADCDVCFSSYEQIDESGEPLNRKVRALNLLTYKKLLKSNYIGNLTGIYNVESLGKITSPNLRKRQDWLLWLAALKKSGKPAIGIKEPLAYYRVRERSISSNKINLLKYNYLVYRKGLRYSSIKSLLFLIIFLMEHFLVKSRQTVTINKI
ncbi:glycosyltransferase family 2 protein [Cognatitamlana onchidii]|uniref:glycosyltransferase family 2 protein n=1 Tax=Cognatitamlana onchidii TaxID=2562860 RepID=UPI0010A63FD6|nr:glycosyltransferase family 2 protein [Algibacter onchidii]